MKGQRVIADTLDDMADSYRLVLLRHGESAWNAKNLFTGWVDVDLTSQGEEEAIRLAASSLLGKTI